jgi:hypothetical protein
MMWGWRLGRACYVQVRRRSRPRPAYVSCPPGAALDISLSTFARPPHPARSGRRPLLYLPDPWPSTTSAQICFHPRALSGHSTLAALNVPRSTCKVAEERSSGGDLCRRMVHWLDHNFLHRNQQLQDQSSCPAAWLDWLSPRNVIHTHHGSLVRPRRVFVRGRGSRVHLTSVGIDEQATQNICSPVYPFSYMFIPLIGLDYHFLVSFYPFSFLISCAAFSYARRLLDIHCQRFYRPKTIL